MISGALPILIMPNTARVTNHNKVIGPNNFPTAAVPYFWIKNRATKITKETGMMNLFNPGAANSIPSTADRTEIAGVITDSPSSMHAPNIPRIMMKRWLFDLLSKERRAKAINERTPPSPLLSARITNKTYFTVTTKISAQIIIEITPKSASGVYAIPCLESKHSLSAYSGLVPMSPKTTPIAASIITPRPFLCSPPVPWTSTGFKCVELENSGLLIDISKPQCDVARQYVTPYTSWLCSLISIQKLRY